MMSLPWGLPAPLGRPPPLTRQNPPPPTPADARNTLLLAHPLLLTAGRTSSVCPARPHVHVCSDAAAGADGSAPAVITSALKVSDFLIDGPLDAEVTLEALRALKSLNVRSDSGAVVSLAVQGVGVVPKTLAELESALTSSSSSVVMILTTAGVVEIDGVGVSVEEDMASFLTRAGVRLADSGAGGAGRRRRRLLGASPLSGTYSSLPTAGGRRPPESPSPATSPAPPVAVKDKPQAPGLMSKAAKDFDDEDW